MKTKYYIRFVWSGAKTDWFDTKTEAMGWARRHGLSKGAFVIESGAR